MGTQSQVALDNRGAVAEKRFYAALTLPAVVTTLLVGILPLALLVIDSFKDMRTGAFTLGNYADTLLNPHFWRLIRSTFLIGVATTVISIALAFPVAYFLARNPRARGLLMSVVMVPRMLPFIVVGYAMILILAPYTGLLNVLLVQQLGVLSTPINILFDLPGLLIALAYSRTVIAIGMLTAIIEKIPVSLEEASLTLGCNRFWTFIKVIVPQTVQGLIGASALIFASTITAYVIPMVLAGRRMLMVSVLIGSNLLSLGRWNLAFAQAVVVTILALTCTFASQYFLSRYQKS